MLEKKCFRFTELHLEKIQDRTFFIPKIKNFDIVENVLQSMQNINNDVL